jgi:hypothetical protein
MGETVSMASDEVSHKDVVIALLGASATLTGLILVFVGLVVGAYLALPGDTPATLKTKLRWTSGLTLVPFGLGLIQVGAATAWLLFQGECLYRLTVWLFVATVVALAGAAFFAWGRLMWG